MIKKNSISCALFVLFMLIACNTVYASSYKSEIKVGIKYGANAGNNVKISCDSGIDIYNAATGELIYFSAFADALDISMGSTGFASYNKFSAENVSKLSVQPKSGGVISCDGVKYRGYIYLEKTASGEMTVINIVGTDDYVASVLGKEMSYSWPQEALKAQAVCARNYALCNKSAHAKYGFDVCTTTHCQVYGGLASEYESTRNAVNATKGVLAKYNGEVVQLYFFATDGGSTEDVENVWGNKLDYLRAVQDPYENPDKASHYTWTASFTKAQVEKKLTDAGVNIGSLTSITVDKVSNAGTVTQLTFHGTAKDYTTKLEKCRTILGLYSGSFTVTSPSSGKIVTTGGTVDSIQVVCTSDNNAAPAALYAISGDGQILPIAQGSQSDDYVINGRGYGHSVGMSQWGARGMAESGFSYTDILKHYFTGIELG